MMRLKAIFFAAALASGSALVSTAQAAPLSPVPADTVAGDPMTTDVGLGCGGGYTRDYYGRCRPVPGYRGPPRFGPPRYGYGGPRYNRGYGYRRRSYY